MITVLLADDQALVRAGFRALLEVQDEIEVVGEALDGAEAYRLAAELRPDVILMDIRMPGTDGLEATRLVTSDERLADVRILILTTFELDEYVFEAIRCGASGFLLKDTEPADLLRGLRAVADGEALLAPSVTRRLISEFARTPALGLSGAMAPGLPAHPGTTGHRPGGAAAAGGAPSAAAPGRAGRVTDLLTDRECEVIRLVAAGMSNGEIADHLRISPATAKTHVAHLLTKLDARDRVQLVIPAAQVLIGAPQVVFRRIDGEVGGAQVAPGVHLVTPGGLRLTLGADEAFDTERGGIPTVFPAIAVEFGHSFLAYRHESGMKGHPH